MNLLSFFSAVLATAFAIGGGYCATRNRKELLNVFSLMVLLLLGWWSLCNAFFFSAATEAEAWKWHRLASIGWTGFIPATTYYFIILTGLHEKMRKAWCQIAFWFLPTILILHNLFGSATCLATSLTKSVIGGQWAYVNDVGRPMLWIYLACLCGYFGFAFSLLLRWARRVHHKQKKRMAVSFVVLDAATILLGFLTDVLFPLTSHLLPSAANLATALFGVGYFFFIIRFDLFNVLHVVEDRDILEHSMEAVMVLDESGEILYCNGACTRLFDCDRHHLMGQKLQKRFDADMAEQQVIRPLTTRGAVQDAELSTRTDAGNVRQLLISASVIRDREDDYLGTVVSLRDVTQLNGLKEQYRRQSDEYQQLALNDALTGIPNRRKTFEVLQELADRYHAAQEDFFILYMDMDNFKSINDRYGHDVGDAFLIAAARRLSDCLSVDMDFVGRLGGDEFMMVGSCLRNRDTVLHCKAVVEQAFTRPFQCGTVAIHSGISVGYAIFSESCDVDAMVRQADAHMYKVKQARKKR